MALTINTNNPSLNAQRNLSTSQGALATSIQRLSSGLRINSAKDDAAGMAIATRMTTQISGLNQAQRNANDGISLSQTTEGALQQVTSNLQRIRELAVQATNASNSASDRTALDQEVQQRISEINRIASQTSFNGQHTLDGTFGSATFQVGANVGETISIGLNTSMKTASIGDFNVATGTVAASAAAAPSSATPLDGTIAAGQFSVAIGTSTAVVVSGTWKSTQDVADAINTQVAGASAWVDKNGMLNIAAQDNSAVAISAVGATAATALGLPAASTLLGAYGTASTGISAASVATAGDANSTILAVDSALKAVSDLRSTLGAMQSRFESVVSSAQTASENLSSSRSRIQDTDFAAETANLSRAQILQQAGTAVLAQANTSQQNVLKLLQ